MLLVAATTAAAVAITFPAFACRFGSVELAAGASTMGTHGNGGVTGARYKTAHEPLAHINDIDPRCPHAGQWQRVQSTAALEWFPAHQALTSQSVVAVAVHPRPRRLTGTLVEQK